MKKSAPVLLTSLLLVVSLSSCAKGANVPLDSDLYQKTLANDFSGEGFKILQLADIHWSFVIDMERSERLMDNVVNLTQPDLIVISGDQVLDINKRMIDRLYHHFDKWGIPYAIVWGNHDWQGTFSRNYPIELAKKGQYSLYTEVEDEVDGRSNYVINVEKGGLAKWQVYLMDSHEYEFRTDSVGEYRYNYIHENQVKWYEAQTEKAGNIPNIAYFHMPTWEWTYEWAKRGMSLEGDIGVLGEEATYKVPGLTGETIDGIEMPEAMPFWPGDSASRIVEAGFEHNMKAIQVGHDHANDWGVTYDGFHDEHTNSIFLGYGVKLGDGCTHNDSAVHDGKTFDLTGGSLLKLHEDGSMRVEHHYFDVKTCDPYSFYQTLDLNTNGDVVSSGWEVRA